MWRTLAVATLALVGTADAQLPIPGKPPGFVLGDGSADAGVQLESYIDLVRSGGLGSSCKYDLQTDGWYLCYCSCVLTASRHILA